MSVPKYYSIAGHVGIFSKSYGYRNQIRARLGDEVLWFEREERVESDITRIYELLRSMEPKAESD